MNNRFRIYTERWIVRETQNSRTHRAGRVLHVLRSSYPNSRIMLYYDTPMQLLVAVMLSAQCTDKQVNRVTPPLFAACKNACDFAMLKQPKLERMIYGTGFYRAKAKNIIAAAHMIVSRHHGNVPGTMEELTALPGVARKTANIVIANAFGKPAGIPVDTHVSRIAQRLGFTTHHRPDNIERDLTELFPRRSWKKLPYLFIEHGRATCRSARPQCAECPIRDYCPSRQDIGTGKRGQ